MKPGAPALVIAAVLARGVLASEAKGEEPGRIYSIWGMPPYDLPPAEREALVAFLQSLK